jgi:hypothetical protein
VTYPVGRVHALRSSSRASLRTRRGPLAWFIPLLLGTGYGVVLAPPGIGLGLATGTDQLLAVSVLLASIPGRVSWLLFGIGASANGLAWGRRVIDVGVGNAQLTEFLAVGMAINVAFRFLSSEHSLPRKMKWLIALAVVPSLLGSVAAVNGASAGNSEYIGPLRACLTLIGVPYGYYNFRDEHKANLLFWGITYVAALSVVARYLLFTGDELSDEGRLAYTGGLGWIMSAAVAIRLFLVPRRFMLLRLAGIILFLFFVVSHLTLTTALGVAVATMLYLVLHTRHALFRGMIAVSLVIITVVLFVLTINIIRDEITYGFGYTHFRLEAGQKSTDILVAPLSRIEYKIYDRVILWVPAVEQIRDAPLELEAGRTLRVPTLTGREDQEWTTHVHNVFLELLRQFGLLGGSLFSVLVLASLLSLYRGWRSAGSENRQLSMWSIFGLSFLPGMILGFYPVSGEVGVYFWLSVGVVSRLRQRNQTETPSKRLHG